MGSTNQTMPANTLSHPKYRAYIDGLRAIAVLSVVIFHAAPNWLRGGFIGVDIFFVISGFLISTIIFSNLESNTFSLQEFYVRRVKRIFPALILMLTTTFAFGWWVLLPDEFAQLGKHITAGVFFVSNLVLWSEAGYFDAAAETKPLLHLWSLGIEEQFYILWPALLLLARKRKYNLLTTIVAVGAISLALNLKGIKNNATATFYSPQTRIWELVAGSLLAWMNLHTHSKLGNLKNTLDNWLHRALYTNNPKGDGKTLSNTLSVFGVALLVFGLLKIEPNLGFPGKWAIVPVLGTIFIIAAGEQSWFNRLILSNRLVVWFGLISFPLYLWHWPFLSFARIMEEGPPDAYIRAAAVLLAIIFAWLTYRLIEKPIRFRASSQWTTGVLCSLMVSAGALGFFTFRQDGLGFPMLSQIDHHLLDQIREPLNTRLSDGSCENLLDFAIGPGAVCLTNNSAPEVLFVGDSHAMSINSAAHLGKIPIKSMLIGLHGCLPFKNYSVLDGKLDKGCNALVDQLFAVLGSHPSIKTVLLNTRGPVYFSGSGYGIEGTSNYSIIALNGQNSSQEDMFHHGYSQLAKDLLRLNKNVVFIIDPPELGENPKGCIVRRPVSISDKPLSLCIQEKEKVISRQSIYRDLIKKISNDNPQMKIYDPIDIFCDSTVCHGKKNGRLLYWDDDHISIEASLLILNDMRQKALIP